MSTSYSASVVFGYLLAADDLVTRTPHPLWGKVKFDPDTGEKVPQFTETEIDLKLKDGWDAKPGEVARHNSGDSIVLGVVLVDADLTYGSGDPDRFTPVVGTQLDKVTARVKEVLAKAGLPFEEVQMGHYVVGSVG